MLLSMFIYAVVASFTPGPNNLMSLYFANRFGLKKSIRFNLGVLFGFFVILALAAIFSEALSAAIPTIEWPMKLFGCGYLLYLAYKIIRSHTKESQSFLEHNNSIKAGALLQFINPKALIYAITVIATFVTPNYHGFLSQSLLVVVLALIGFLGTVFWGLFGSVFKRWIVEHQLLFNIIMALLLVYAAISILIG